LSSFSPFSSDSSNLHSGRSQYNSSTETDSIVTNTNALGTSVTIDQIKNYSNRQRKFKKLTGSDKAIRYVIFHDPIKRNQIWCTLDYDSPCLMCGGMKEFVIPKIGLCYHCLQRRQDHVPLDDFELNAILEWESIHTKKYTPQHGKCLNCRTLGLTVKIGGHISFEVRGYAYCKHCNGYVNSWNANNRCKCCGYQIRRDARRKLRSRVLNTNFAPDNEQELHVDCQ